MAAELKACKDCGQELPVSSFYHHPETRDRLFPICKSCHKEHTSQWRAGNSEKVQAIQARGRAKNREKLSEKALDRYYQNREQIISQMKLKRARFAATLNLWKAAQGCKYCGTHYLPLQYHHVDPSTKKREVATMYSRSLTALYDEIALCTVVCEPCHWIEHRRLKEAV
jgi:hypothetical protein